VFERVRLTKAVVHFARERLPYYGPLLTQDLHRFRDEVVKATLGAGVSLAAGLIFGCFLSIAVIVSAWDAPHRILTAWIVCLVWGTLAAAGLVAARRALKGPLPFRLVAAALSRDYASFAQSIAQISDPAHAHPQR
jgi:hypothetical protein